ncbi:PIR protein [Plasmodium reichenowi]|uniref:PIR protein n=1 Tax=Plasmodium reichenowi TaxID=5854 RepID=A0A2P9DSM8_PLARE|nr:PIR protein [Plasmodium reichenowi]
MVIISIPPMMIITMYLIEEKIIICYSSGLSFLLLFLYHFIIIHIIYLKYNTFFYFVKQIKYV